MELRPLAIVPGGAALRDTCEQTIVARKLFSKIREFVHGAKADIANEILGPARMLIKEGIRQEKLAIQDSSGFNRMVEDGWSDWIINTAQARERAASAFDKIAVGLDAYEHHLATDLLESWQAIREWLGSPGSWREAPLLDIDRLMALMTEIRILSGAGVQELPTGGSNVPVVNAIRGEPAQTIGQNGDMGSASGGGIEFRVLVVDDNASDWMPVFRIITQQLADALNHPVTLEFSSDAKNVRMWGSQPAEKPADLWRVLPEYDLILLDIYLPGEQSGIEILKKTRERVDWLPVILWTSSLDHGLAAQASMDNGYVFKKTATIDEIVVLLKQWIDWGQCRRLVSLPNPFFDHMIKSSSARRLALDFTAYCLKLMDSFHALDEEYLKFFNDHGGRHIVTLIGILEQLLRPLLYEKTIFVRDGVRLEGHILALYLAALCHEIGMFPITDTRHAHNKQQAQLARKGHPVLGMQVIMDNARRDEFGRLATRLAREMDADLRAQVALIVGHHDRLLDLRKFGDIPDASDKLGMLKVPTETNQHNSYDDLLDQALVALRVALDVIPPTQHDVVKKLCGLHSFADAIDIDYTRVPADFLLFGSRRGPRQDVEDLKRQVVERVIIDRGRVSLQFRMPYFPGNKDRPGIKPPDRPLCIREFVSDVCAVNGTGNDPKTESAGIDKHIEEQIESMRKLHGEERLSVARGAAQEAVKSVACFLVMAYEETIRAVGLDSAITLGDLAWGTKDDICKVTILSDPPVSG
ncbi:MAG: response regulator [bacterium]